MARKRMIDPNIWEDPDFASLSRDARLLFIGLISNADDEGYLRGHPGALKRLVFGFDNDMSTDATQLLIKELQEKIKNLNFYEMNNQIYIHICTWFKYQKQQKDRIVPTIFPLCSKCLASAKHLLTEVKLSKEKLIEEKRREVNKDSDTFSNENGRCPLREKEGHKSCIHLIDLIAQEKKTKFPNYGKQINALHKSLRAGFKLEDVEDMAAQLIGDSFYKDAGWDLMTVANELGKKGQINA